MIFFLNFTVKVSKSFKFKTALRILDVQRMFVKTDFAILAIKRDLNS